MHPVPVIYDGVGVPPAEWHAIAQLLYREAELLDAGRLTDWLALVAPAIDYRILNRVTRDRTATHTAFDEDSFHLRCDRPALEARIARLSSEFAWSEETPAATRRFVSNIRALQSTGAELQVKSNLLLFRSRWDASTFISMERSDRWIADTSHFLLAQRSVYVDHAVLPVENLGALL